MFWKCPYMAFNSGRYIISQFQNDLISNEIIVLKAKIDDFRNHHFYPNYCLYKTLLYIDDKKKWKLQVMVFILSKEQKIPFKKTFLPFTQSSLPFTQ
jgi:hypothetical protein